MYQYAYQQSEAQGKPFNFQLFGTPLEIVFHERSYSSLHSGWTLAWDHFCGDIADSCGVVVIPEAISGW